MHIGDCPKCYKHLVYRAMEECIYKKCLHCGYLKLEYRLLAGELVKWETVETHYAIPRSGTKMYIVLKCLKSGKGKTTIEVADQSGEESKSASSILSTLRRRGLVFQTKAGKGIKGGSIWKIEPSVINSLM